MKLPSIQNSVLKKPQGFTLVELLIVVSILGILAGVMLNVIQVGTQRDRANNAVRESNLEKIRTAIEAYYANEGIYPISNASNTPMDDSRMSTYLSGWPGNGTSEVYVYNRQGTGQSAGVFVMVSGSTTCFKYHTSWADGGIKECIADSCNATTSACN